MFLRYQTKPWKSSDLAFAYWQWYSLCWAAISVVQEPSSAAGKPGSRYARTGCAAASSGGAGTPTTTAPPRWTARATAGAAPPHPAARQLSEQPIITTIRLRTTGTWWPLAPSAPLGTPASHTRGAASMAGPLSAAPPAPQAVTPAADAWGFVFIEMFVQFSQSQNCHKLLLIMLEVWILDRSQLSSWKVIIIIIFMDC